MKGLPIFIAALGGALVGAATALLLAPQKGSDTREAIKGFIRSHVRASKTANSTASPTRLPKKSKK